MSPPQSTVCVVDDNPSVLKSIHRLFLNTNLAICGFEDPAAFLDYAKGNPVDLAILDIRMPGPISGLDLQRRLQELHPGAPVIIITANNESATRETALTNGAFHFFLKPFDGHDLVNATQEALSSKESTTHNHPLNT